MAILYKALSDKIIGICIDIHKELGSGFLESVYKHTIAYEFTKNKFHYEKEKLLSIKYKDTIIDKAFYADFVI